jgi:hypothetical protein
MKKVKLYNPIKKNTWVMMFGFPPPKEMNYKRKFYK